MLVLDPTAAEKALIAGYVVLLPAALLYAIRGIDPGRGWLAIAAIPLTFTFTFAYGFYNFSYGVAVFLLVTGTTIRYLRRPSARGAVGIGALFLLSYSVHIVPFVEGLLLTAILAATWAFITLRRTDADRSRVVRPLTSLALAAMPSVLRLLVFLVTTRSGSPGHYRDPWLPLAATVAFVWPLVTFDLREALFCVLLSGAVLGTAGYVLWARRRDRRIDLVDGFLAYALVALVAVALSPASVASGGGVVLERLSLFPVYGMVLWLAGQAIPTPSARAIVAASLVAAVGFLALRLPAYLYLSDRATDYLAVAECVAPRSTLVQVNLSLIRPSPFRRMDPFIEETGLLSAATAGHDLGSAEGSVPFYPLQNRPENDPYVHLVTTDDLIYHIPPAIDPLGYEADTSGRVDYLLVYGRDEATPDVLASPAWSSLSTQLADGYRRVAVSPAGHLEVYERADVPTASAGEAARTSAAAEACPSASLGLESSRPRG
jgi:hypothetical protein